MPEGIDLSNPVAGLLLIAAALVLVYLAIRVLSSIVRLATSLLVVAALLGAAYYFFPKETMGILNAAIEFFTMLFQRLTGALPKG
ncbi:MAG: hypothetical protein HY335_07170 [Deinococcus sp.]|nr:hypothetical protein [Deinococcus sp.]